MPSRFDGGACDVVLASARPGYTAAQLRELASGMEGGPASLVIVGIVVLSVGFFTLLFLAARQTAAEEELREAERSRRRATAHRAQTAEDRMWRRTGQHEARSGPALSNPPNASAEAPTIVVPTPGNP